MTPKQISETFGVSQEAAKNRLKRIEEMVRLENGTSREIPDFVKQFLESAPGKKNLFP